MDVPVRRWIAGVGMRASIRSERVKELRRRSECVSGRSWQGAVREFRRVWRVCDRGIRAARCRHGRPEAAAAGGCFSHALRALDLPILWVLPVANPAPVRTRCRESWPCAHDPRGPPMACLRASHLRAASRVLLEKNKPVLFLILEPGPSHPRRLLAIRSQRFRQRSRQRGFERGVVHRCGGWRPARPAGRQRTPGWGPAKQRESPD